MRERTSDPAHAQDSPICVSTQSVTLLTFYQFPQKHFKKILTQRGKANTQDKGFNPVFIPHS